MSSEYSAHHLQVLEGLEAVRKRPGMYIGSNDSRGLMHCLWEIIDNSVDEALGGFGDKIAIILHTDGSVGMLEVFKKYRRCGVGSALVSHMNNYHADRGWTVYGQVYFDNDVSLAMQRRLGLAESEDYIRWISGKDTF